MTKRRHIFAALYVLALTALCLVLAMEETEAATYNFYFNNTEQGANSTATPSVTVQDGKLVKKPGDPSTATSTATSTEIGTGNGTSLPMDQTPAEGESIQETPEPVGTSASSAGEIGAMERTFPDAKWKVTVGASSMNYKSDYWERYGLKSERDDRSRISAALTYYPLPELGFGARIGRLTGVELEFNPLRTRTGWGKLQLGGTAGVFRESLGIRRSRNYEEPRYGGDVSVRAFIGAHVGLNIVRDLVLGYSYRFAPIERNKYTMAMNEVGLSYLF